MGVRKGVAATQPQPARKKKEVVLVCCRDCKECVAVTEFHTLTVHGREPTLGRCPYWTESRSFLLSQRIACGRFQRKME